MPHTIREKDKLLARVRRLKGQVESVERALETGEDCSVVLHRIAACRGALGGLMFVVLEGHVREHLIDEVKHPTSRQLEAADDIVKILRSYLK